MLGTHDLPLFLGSAVALNLVPGQDTLYILGRSLSQGRRAGVWSALGISCGCFVHTLAAALGLSAILATSATAFLAIKLAGAAYLVYLGVMLWREPRPTSSLPPTSGPHSSAAATSSARIFWSGLLTNVLNPKVALFFLAFLPQFVEADAPSKFVAFLFLGGLFIITGTTWCLVLALAASSISRRLRTGAAAGRLARRAAGALFVGLGVKLAVSK
jgi:threonine/homoserine/homoserine lactone efflux protein